MTTVAWVRALNMRVPSQRFYWTNALSHALAMFSFHIVEYDCGKSIYMSDVFLLYYWGGNNVLPAKTKEDEVYNKNDEHNKNKIVDEHNKNLRSQVGMLKIGEVQVLSVK